MRTFTSTAAIAAIFLSSAVGFASAGSHYDSQREHSRSGFTEGNEGSYYPMIPQSVPTPLPFAGLIATPTTASPRMARLAAAVERMESRIDRDEARGNLDSGQARTLTRDVEEVRSTAMAAAERQHGSVTKAQFAQYQGELNHLGHVTKQLSGEKPLA